MSIAKAFSPLAEPVDLLSLKSRHFRVFEDVGFSSACLYVIMIPTKRNL